MGNTREGSVGQTGRALQTPDEVNAGVNPRTRCIEGGSGAVIGRAVEAESELLNCGI